MTTALTAYLPDEFFTKLKMIAAKRNFHPADALAVMLYESGVNPKAIHPTAAGSGIFGKMFPTRDEAVAFTKVSAVDQLDAYDAYMAPYTNVPKATAANLYQLNFLPASAIPGQANYRGVNADAVLAAKDGTGYSGHEASYYKENANLDRDNSGAITVGDLGNALAVAQGQNKAKWTELMQRLGETPSSLPTYPNQPAIASSKSYVPAVLVLGAIGIAAKIVYDKKVKS